MTHDRQLTVRLLHRAVPVEQASDGLRALVKLKPIDPASIERYRSGKFDPSLGAARRAMARLAGTLTPRESALQAYALY